MIGAYFKEKMLIFSLQDSNNYAFFYENDINNDAQLFIVTL
tara:strand:- start:1320 stop:1442 length:123 start_codon:yes stop_codon:yes gene_type:complete